MKHRGHITIIDVVFRLLCLLYFLSLAIISAFLRPLIFIPRLFARSLSSTTVHLSNDFRTGLPPTTVAYVPYDDLRLFSISASIFIGFGYSPVPTGSSDTGGGTTSGTGGGTTSGTRGGTTYGTTSELKLIAYDLLITFRIKEI